MSVLIIVFLVLSAAIIVSACKQDDESEKEIAENRTEKLNNNLQSVEKSMEIAAANGFTVSNSVNDSGFNFSVAVDNVHKEWLVLFPERNILRIFKFSDLISYRIVQNGRAVISGNTGKAALGGVLFGAAGAVAGAASKKTVSEMCSDLHIEITVSDVSCPLIKLPCISHEEISVNSALFNQQMGIAKRVEALLSYIKANAEQPKPEVPEQPAQKSLEQPKPDIYAEIEKLHALKEKGIITEEEFTQKKKSLLGI